MPFIRNLWYVAAWSHELEAGQPRGVQVIGEPIVLYRRGDGGAVALEDRCPHRHAPLSLGRIEGDDLRCMYHGLRFRSDGSCAEVPGVTRVPPRLCARSFPVVERHGWVWVWSGDPARADPALVPAAFGLGDPDWVYRSGGIDYEADYELLNDNLCDLSHLDFVHETSLGRSTGAKWSTEQPRIVAEPNGLRFERWFRDHPITPGRSERVDTWSSYRYLLPGIFLLGTQSFPVGTAEASQLGAPDAKPLLSRIDQQSVTPLGVGRSRYLWGFGLPRAFATPSFVDGVYRVVKTSFDEDRRMIEAQQAIWKATSPEQPRGFIPQDQGPALFRRMIAQRLADEAR
ncbi:MAG TPA: aromatic ring-hydroxylating dioxygenase subunit alpha [Myxococcota bacterium]|nr:aromatic ring-hydroxylating dioxygenase subunit alpha [Myxococcota bacterium]